MRASIREDRCPFFLTKMTVSVIMVVRNTVESDVLIHTHEEGMIMENNAPGRLKLKVTGILYIIQAAITILLGLLALAGGTMFLSVDGVDSSVGSVLGIIAGIVGIVIIVSAAYSLIVGILGVKNSNKPEKCGVNFVLGIITIVFCGFSLLFGILAVAGGGEVTSLISPVIALIIAIFYTVGAKQNKDAVRYSNDY